MIEILEKYFVEVIRLAATLYILLGIILVFYKVPKDEVYRRYRTSKYLLALAFWVICANLLLWLFTFDDDWHKIQPAVQCIDLILFYLSGILLSYSFSNLLDKHFICKKRLAIDFSKWGVSSAIALFSLTNMVADYRQELLFVSLLFLIEFFARYLFYFRKTYVRNEELLDDYFSSENHHIIQWIKRSIVLIFILGNLGIISINTGIIFNWTYQVYVICTNLYIAFSFINYAQPYGNLYKAAGEEASVAPTNAADKTEVKEERARQDGADKKTAESFAEMIKPRIAVWVNNKRFTAEQFTIEDLATFLGTNKSYLSRYIRETYDMNFSTWVASLRLEEAKQMMLADNDKKLEEIAFAVGFSSLSYFSKVFSKLEGVSPSVWLRECSR